MTALLLLVLIVLVVVAWSDIGTVNENVTLLEKKVDELLKRK
jgi:hypothetical protein